MLLPHFHPDIFDHFRAWQKSNFGSSKFRLANLLEMLPGQANHGEAVFEAWELQSHIDDDHALDSSCSRLGLASFICRYFHSVTDEGGHIAVRTTVGKFEIPHSGQGTAIRFFPQIRAPETHRMSTGDALSICKLADGQIRLSQNAFSADHNGEKGNESARWRRVPIRRAILTPGLDLPPCVRFATQLEIDFLEKMREGSVAFIWAAIRFLDQGTGNNSTTRSAIMRTLSDYRSGIYSSPVTASTASESHWIVSAAAIGATGEGMQEIQRRMGPTAIDEFVEILNGRTHINARELDDLVTTLHLRHRFLGFAYFIAHAIVISMNCSILLSLSCASPHSWIDFLTSSEVNVYIE